MIAQLLRSSRAAKTTLRRMTTDVNMGKYDPVQVEFMKEAIPIVDRDDNVLRPGSKKECHLNENIAKGLLHRAFSVFLFNKVSVRKKNWVLLFVSHKSGAVL